MKTSPSTRWFWACAPLLACAPSVNPCVSPGACSHGYECLANRCVIAGGEPVRAGSVRLVLHPEALAVVSRAGDALTQLPATVTFGAANGPDDTLLLRFGTEWASLDVEAAFLLVAPLEAAEPAGEDTHLVLGSIDAQWTAETLRDGIPGTVGPSSAAVGRSNSSLPLRFDVTAMLTAAADKPSAYHGFLLTSEGSSTTGATYTTGSVNGRVPVLEIYGRRKPLHAATP